MSLRQSDIIVGVKLEDLQATAAVRGILSDALITVVSARWFGSDALELTYRGAGGELGSEILYRDDEARLEMVGRGGRGASTATGSCFGWCPRRCASTSPICSTLRWRCTPRWWSRCRIRSPRLAAACAARAGWTPASSMIARLSRRSIVTSGLSFAVTDDPTRHEVAVAIQPLADERSLLSGLRRRYAVRHREGFDRHNPGWLTFARRLRERDLAPPWPT